MQNLKLTFLIRFSALLFFFFISQSIFAVDFNTENVSAKELVSEMSDDEALAQVFMYGWAGEEPSALILDWISKRRIGGVKVFGWNAANTTTLAGTIARMQSTAMNSGQKIPLLVATDQEGGLVRHVKGATSETPGNMAIGASGYPNDAYLSGYYIGRELAALGINMNFAPTVDLFTNTRSELIGTRSFGDDPVHAGILGAAFAAGSIAAGVIPTAKHFPGHGDTALDSHGILPKINADFELAWDRELVPYRILAKEKIPAIMSGHLSYPNTEGGAAPASLSPYFLQNVLREKIAYQGLIITDDLMMQGAVTYSLNLSRACKFALAAGNDMIMMNKTLVLDDFVWTFLRDSMKNEPDFRIRVLEAATNVVKLKLTYLKGERSIKLIPDTGKLNEHLPDKEGTVFFQDLEVRSITIVKNDIGLLPQKADTAGRVLLAGQDLDFFAAGRKAFPGASSFWYDAPVSSDFLSRARNADVIVFYLADEEGLSVLRQLQGFSSKLIVFFVRNPAYIDRIPWINTAIAVYSNSNLSFNAGFSAILGTFSAKGSVPFANFSK